MTGVGRFGPGAFRLVLASFVFLSHVSRINLGRAAVVLFFMLSGFWVTRMFDLRRDPSVVPYIRDRFLRVWPLLAVVAIAIAVGFALAGRPAPGSVLSTIALLGLATRHGDVIGTAWSLDIEMQFYLLLPLVALAVARTAAAWRPVVVAIIVATVAGAALREQGIATVFAYAPAFAAGAFIWRSKWSPNARTALQSLAAYAVLLAILAAIPALRWTVLTSRELPWWFDLSQIAACSLLIPFVAWNVNQPSPPLDRHLGNLSYPFYLVHYPLIAATSGLIASAMANKALALGLSIVASLVLYTAVDRPLERVRKVVLRPSRRAVV